MSNVPLGNCFGTVVGGRNTGQVGDRADRVVARARRASGNVLLFSSVHFLRVLTARWLGLDAEAGKYFLLEPGITQCVKTQKIEA